MNVQDILSGISFTLRERDLNQQNNTQVDAHLTIITKDALTYKKPFTMYPRMANTSWLGN